MATFGWIIASIGVVGLVSSVILEIKHREPLYMLLTKVSAGTLGIGGIILGISALAR